MRKLLPLLIFTLLLLLVLLPKICLEGATTGLLLWFEHVIPALFPFFVFSKIILALNICPKKLKPFYPVVMGMISGCPTGTYLLADMIDEGTLTKQKAQSMLILCNNASPAFLINYIGCGCMPAGNNKYLALICIVISSFMVFLINKLINNIKNKHYNYISKNYNSNNKHTHYKTPGSSTLHSNDHKTPESFSCILESTILKSAELLVLIGGYIILFSIISNIIIHIVPYAIPKLLLGSIPEITVGSKLLSTTSLIQNEQIKSAAIATLCGFGGLCGISQTIAPIRSSGMSVRSYVLNRMFCGIISGLLFFTLHIIIIEIQSL